MEIDTPFVVRLNKDLLRDLRTLFNLPRPTSYHEISFSAWRKFTGTTLLSALP